MATSPDAPKPDPRASAVILGLLFLLAGLAVAIVFDVGDWDRRPFEPAKQADANFALFAGFYVAAQIVERLLEPIAPLFPLKRATGGTATENLAQDRADRAMTILGLAALLGRCSARRSASTSYSRSAWTRHAG